MEPDPFERDHAPPVGRVEALARGLRCVTAPNAGPMTFTGTRTYLLGEGEVAVVDPGPADDRHLDALAAALEPGERVTAVLVTHAHRDHSGGAAAAGARLDAPVLAHGGALGARNPALANIGGGAGLDAGFRPDRRIEEGATIAGRGWTLRALETPGHLGDHLSFAWEEGSSIFSGDHVMGWSSTLISPPDGDLRAYLASLARLRARAEGVYYPGHGAPVPRPHALIDWLIAHRAAREAQIRAALATGPLDAVGIAAQVYAGLDARLAPAAARNVLAHLVDLVHRGIVSAEGPLRAEALFFLT